MPCMQVLNRTTDFSAIFAKSIRGRAQSLSYRVPVVFSRMNSRATTAISGPTGNMLR